MGPLVIPVTNFMNIPKDNKRILVPSTQHHGNIPTINENDSIPPWGDKLFHEDLLLETGRFLSRLMILRDDVILHDFFQITSDYKSKFQFTFNLINFGNMMQNLWNFIMLLWLYAVATSFQCTQKKSKIGHMIGLLCHITCTSSPK